MKLKLKSEVMTEKSHLLDKVKKKKPTPLQFLKNLNAPKPQHFNIPHT